MNPDLIIIAIFLVITFAIGLYASKGVKNFQEYAVGNRKMRSFVIAISLIATSYGGRSLTHGVEIHYEYGFYHLMSTIAHIVGLYLTARFIILRMQAFVGHLSIAESMGHLYGPIVRMVTGIFSIIFSTLILTSQLTVGLTIAKMIYPEIKEFSHYATIILALLVITYSTFGGARAVALTDVYQFFLFGLCFPILIFMSFYYVNNPIANWQRLTAIPHFNISKVITIDNILRWISVSLLWAVFSIFDPPSIQRFYMTASTKEAAKTLYKRIMIEASLIILFFTIAVAVHLGDHVIGTNQHVIDYLIQLAYFPGMLGILVTALIALIMSTIDSCLHTSTVLLTNDVLPVIVGSPKWLTKYQLKTTRIISVLVGITSMCITWYPIDYAKVFDITGLYYLTFIIPLIIASFGFKPHSIAVLLNMALNMMLSSIVNVSILQALFLNLFILITTHYLLPKRPNTGWIGVKELTALDLQNQETKRWWLRRLQNCKLCFTKAYWKNCFPKKTSTFMVLGVYIIINTLIALFYMEKDYFSRYIYWYILVIACGTILIIYPSFKRYHPTGSPILHGAWPILLFILLFFSSIQFVKLAHFRPMVYMLSIVSLALGIILLSLKAGIIMFSIAMILHKFIPPYIACFSSFFSIDRIISIEFVLAITILMPTLVGFAIYKYLRDKIDMKLKIIALARVYERKAALELIYNQVNWSKLHPIYGNKMLEEMGTILQAPCAYFYKNGQAQLGGEINRFIKRFDKFSNFLLNRVKEERILTLNKKVVKPVAIDLAILRAHNTALRLGEPIALLLRNQTKIMHLIADPDLFERLLTVNLFEISKSEQATDHMVTLTIADTVLRYDYENTIPSNNHALTLRALAFFISTDNHMPSVKRIYDIKHDALYNHLPNSENQLYQAESRQIVQAHGGYDTIIQTKETLTYGYVLPVNGEKVMRFKTYDPTALSYKTSETEESIAQEQELVALLTMETTLTKEMIEKTISFIKNAHGLVTRKSGAPYYTHPMAVAKILLEITKDPTTILAGLLHDVVEDTLIPLTQVELMYGAQVAYIVNMVTHYNTSGYRWKLDDKENKNLLDQCKDIRVVQVKLADRLHNLRTLLFRKPVDQKRIAQETITFYIPWATKNNIAQWVPEMSYICKTILNQKE
ncbi:sodium:solute symporter family protein [Candidatus Cardinium hertigii]|uniref:sodium:solute symporter family protein n=1 Tax=Candidatus Cardinium hertigii TaxID=247481 RepID=UPI001FAA4867|nr:sodium:solute symporter family protein [Candidatus Cardinium hertigii]